MAGARASTPARPTGSPTVDPQGDTLEQINRGADNDHWASEGWSGRLVTLSGNESLVLDLSHVAYEIHSGRVAVFYSEQLGGKGWGRRVPICSCSRGDLIGPGIGGAIPAGPEVRRAALELVALDEVQLLRRSIPDGPEPLDEEDLPALGLERWISRVAPRIAECRGDEQLLDLELRSGFTVLAGESFCHREDGLRWVRVHRGRLRLGSADGRWLGPDSAPLPLPPRFPLWAHEDCEISFEESLPATTGELLGGLGWIHGALMDAEHARIARQVVAERRRLEQADFV